MRDSWAEVTLGDVADINPDNTDQLRDNDEITYIDLSSVSSAAGISADLFRGSYRTAPGRARRIVRKDDVLISTVRPYLKGFSMVPQYLDGAVASTGFCVLRAKRKQILPGLIWAVVGTDQFVENLMSKATGSSYPAVRPSDVAAHPIALPPLAEQTRIVDVMSSVDEYIAALQQQADDARTMRKAVLYALLTPGRAEWTVRTPNVRRFEEMAHLKRGHDLPIQSRKDGEYAVIASNGIVDHHHSNEGPIPGVITGRSGTIGKVFYTESGYWPLNTTLYATDFMGNVERFVALTLEVMQLENFAGGTTVPSLDRKVFRQELVYVPNVSEQTQIVATVSALDKVIQSTDQAVFGAKKLRSGLLSGLLSGDHEIPETYDRLLGAA